MYSPIVSEVDMSNTVVGADFHKDVGEGHLNVLRLTGEDEDVLPAAHRQLVAPGRADRAECVVHLVMN